MIRKFINKFVCRNNPIEPVSSKKELSIAVVSPYSKDGKTTLIEVLCGKNIEWSPYTLVDDFTCNKALVSYKGTEISIFEIPQISSDNSNVWQNLAEFLLKSDLIIYVIDSSVKLVLSDIDDFFDIEINGMALSNLVMSKRLVVFTKSDKEKECDVWWNSLTKEEQEEYNKKNSTLGNPEFNTWYETLVNDWHLCWGFWLIANVKKTDDIYEVSCKNMDGIEDLKIRIIKFLDSSI